MVYRYVIQVRTVARGCGLGDGFLVARGGDAVEQEAGHCSVVVRQDVRALVCRNPLRVGLAALLFDRTRHHPCELGFYSTVQ